MWYSAGPVTHLQLLVDTYCECGLVLPGASEEAKEQVLKNVINCFNVLTTSAFVFQNWKVHREHNWLPRRRSIGPHSA